MAEVKNMLHKVQHLFLSTSVSAQSYDRRLAWSVAEEGIRQVKGDEIGEGEESKRVKSDER